MSVPVRAPGDVALIAQPDELHARIESEQRPITIRPMTTEERARYGLVKVPDFTRDHVIEALTTTPNYTEAAHKLGVNSFTLNTLMDRHQIRIGVDIPDRERRAVPVAKHRKVEEVAAEHPREKLLSMLQTAGRAAVAQRLAISWEMIGKLMEHYDLQPGRDYPDRTAHSRVKDTPTAVQMTPPAPIPEVEAPAAPVQPAPREAESKAEGLIDRVARLERLLARCQEQLAAHQRMLVGGSE